MLWSEWEERVERFCAKIYEKVKERKEEKRVIESSVQKIATGTYFCGSHKAELMKIIPKIINGFLTVFKNLNFFYVFEIYVRFKYVL